MVTARGVVPLAALCAVFLAAAADFCAGSPTVLAERGVVLLTAPRGASPAVPLAGQPCSQLVSRTSRPAAVLATTGVLR